MRKVIQRKEWDKYYYFSRQRPFQKKIKNEPPEREIDKVNIVLHELHEFGLIPHTTYDMEKFEIYRKLVHENFFIYWTAINPPMERLLYALSDILRPKVIVGIGIFTGNPVAWSMGPAIMGEYHAERLVAVEIEPDHARICDENFKKVVGLAIEKGVVRDPPSFSEVEVRAEDGFKVIEEFKDASIDLLYLDANGYDPETGRSSKNINTSLLKKAYPKIKPHGYAMCHNVYQPSFRKVAAGYLKFTDNEEFFEKTATCAIDEMGLEVSLKKA